MSDDEDPTPPPPPRPDTGDTFKRIEESGGNRPRPGKDEGSQ